MNSKPSSENNEPFDPFKKPDYAPSPENEGKPSGNETPKKGMWEQLLGKHVPKETKKEEPKSKGIFGEGISRGKFREELRKAYDPNIPIKTPERVALEKEMSWSKYGEEISDKDVKRHLKDLNKEKFREPHYKDQLAIKGKIKIFEKLKNKEK